MNKMAVTVDDLPVGVEHHGEKSGVAHKFPDAPSGMPSVGSNPVFVSGTVAPLSLRYITMTGLVYRPSK
jgi:hypothetical protein